MKKFLSAVLAIALCMSCMLMLASCDKKSKIVGTYEMVSVEGTMTAYGETISLSEDLYDFYRITLEKDGSALVESKGMGSTSIMEQECTWEYEDDVIKLKTNTAGITVVEKLEWDDGTITYSANESAQGVTISFTIVLEKK